MNRSVMYKNEFHKYVALMHQLTTLIDGPSKQQTSSGTQWYFGQHCSM